MDLSPKFAAVLFDCDGVLVDSESITNEVLRGMLADMGWDLTQEEAVARWAKNAPSKVRTSRRGPGLAERG